MFWQYVINFFKGKPVYILIFIQICETMVTVLNGRCAAEPGSYHIAGGIPVE